jgi:phenylalanyl-tRNA synthetase beta chain
MASIKFSRKEFEKYLKITKEIEEKISLMGTHLESINEQEIELEILPNRPDLFSLHGFLRALLAFIDKKPGLKEYKVNKPEKNFEVIIDKSVRDVRPFTACAIVKNLKFDDDKIKEIIDIQEKLHSTLGRNRKKIAIGIYPLEKIALPIKFEARHPINIKFTPLESNREMNGLEILQSHPTGKEYSKLLEGKPKFPVFVDANNEILSMPPIINSHKTGKITSSTESIFIECSGFDFDILKKTLNILVTMFADMQGEIYQMKLNYGKPEITPNLEPEKMKLNLEQVNKTLGLNLQEKEIKKYLEMMGYGYKNKEVLIPCYRTDILHEVDLIEDIAIAYGYENFIPEIPQISTIGQESSKEIRKRKISEILTGLGFLETLSFHLITKEDAKKINLKQEIGVEDSKTDYKILRPNLLVNSLKILSENIDSEYPQKIFEIGRVFSIDSKEETGIKESNHLAIAIAPSNFTEIKQVLQYLERMLNIKLDIQESSNPLFIEGRTAKIIYNGKEIGVMGEISPLALRLWKIKMPFSALEIDISDLLASA